jgi:hypothetical protein
MITDPPRQRRGGTAALALVAALGVATPPAIAHHSAAMFDSSKLQLLRGTVLSMSYVNPHSWISVMGRRDTDPGAARWDVEATSPAQLASIGIQRTTLKAGEKVTIGIRPLRDGRHGGSFVFVIAADGTRYGADPATLGLKLDELRPK